MKTIYKIARTELRTLFYSPIAWFLLIAFFVQSATIYMASIKSYTGTQEIGGEYLKSMEYLTVIIFGGEYGLVPMMMRRLYLFIPLITMGLLSRETGSGTIKLLFSSPINVRKIVFGKFLAMVFFNLFVMALVAVFGVSICLHITNADVGTVFSCLLGLYLLLCTYSAIGLFMSSLTSYQVVAAVCTFVMIGALTYVGGVWQNIDFIRDLTYFLSLQSRTDKMMTGLISSKDVMYFLVISSIFIGLTIVKLKSGRESKPIWVTAARYTLVIAMGLLVGYLSTFPRFAIYYDATTLKTQTLTPNAKRIVLELKDAPLKITTYNNLIGRFSWSGFPQQQNRTLAMWDKYLRFKPDIDFPFVQYYDEPIDSEDPFFHLYGGKSAKEVAQDVATGNQFSLSIVKSPEEIRKEVDLRPELNRYVMLLEWKGRKTFLRTYDDAAVFPSETEVSAAFKRLLQSNLPKAAFVTGNFERNINKAGGRNYKTLTNTPNFRNALINQGFDVDTVNLDVQEINNDVNILVLADPRSELSGTAIQKLTSYINNGGNLLIAGEPGKQSVLNPVFNSLGIQLKNGMIVAPTKDRTPDIVLGQILPAGIALEPSLAKLVADSIPLAMVGTTGINLDSVTAFSVIPFVSSDPKNTWITSTPVVTDSAAVKFNADAGDQKGKQVLALGLTRNVGNKEQRIAVVGDADFMSNGQLMRSDLETANFLFATGLFRWLNYAEFPIDTSRPPSIDNRTTLRMKNILLLNLMYSWMLPGLMIAFAAVLLIRRKRK